MMGPKQILGVFLAFLARRLAPFSKPKLAAVVKPVEKERKPSDFSSTQAKGWYRGVRKKRSDAKKKRQRNRKK